MIRPIAKLFVLIFLLFVSAACYSQDIQLRIPLQHNTEIRDFIYKPDGKIVATIAENDVEVKLWDTHTARLLYTLNGHTAPINAVAFNNNGTRLMTVSSDSTFCIWNTDNGALIESVNTHKPLEMGAFLTQGKKIITKASDTLKLWNAETYEFVSKVNVKKSSFSSKEYRRQQITVMGNSVLVPVGNNVCNVYELNGNEIEYKYEFKGDYFTIAPDGKFVFSADNTGKIVVSNLKTGSQVSVLQENKKAVVKIEFSPDGKKMISSAGDGIAIIWEYPSFKKINELDTHSFNCTLVDISPDNKLFACLGEGRETNKIYVLDILTGNPKVIIPQTATKLNFIGNAELLLFSRDKIQIWNAVTGIMKFEILQPTENKGSSFKFKISPDNNFLALQVNNPATELKVFNLNDGKLTASLKEGISNMDKFQFTGNDNNIIISDGDESNIWDFKRGDKLTTYNRDIFFYTNNQEAFIKRGNAFTALISHIKSGKIIDSVNYKLVEPEFKQPKALVLSSDGRTIVSLHAGDRSSRYGKDVLVYNLSTKKKKMSIRSNTYFTNAIITASGSYLLLADTRWSYLDIWDLRQSSLVNHFDLDNRRHEAVKISDNEKYIITGNAVLDFVTGSNVSFYSAQLGLNNVYDAGFFKNNIVYTTSGAKINFWELPENKMVFSIGYEDGNRTLKRNNYIFQGNENVILQQKNNHITLWPYNGREVVDSFYGVKARINSFEFDSSSSSFILLNYLSNRVRIFDAVNANEVNALHMSAIADRFDRAVFLMKDKRRIITTGGETVQCWNINEDEPIVSVEKANRFFSFPPSYTPNHSGNKALITYGHYALYHMINLESGAIMYSGEYPSGSYGQTPLFSPDDSIFIVYSKDSLTAFVTSTGKRLYSWSVTFDGMFANDQQINGVQFSADGKSFFVFVHALKTPTTLTRHSAIDGKPVSLLKKYESIIQPVNIKFSVSADNKNLIVYSLSTSIFKMASGKELFPENQKSYSVTSISDDRRFLFVIGSSGSAGIYDASTLKHISEIKVTSNRLKKSRFDTESKKLYTSVEYGVVKQWDISTGKLEKTFKGMDLAGPIYSFKNDRYLLSQGEDAITVFDNLNAKEICRYVFFDSGYVVTLPSGYFMADKESVRKLYYVKGLQTIGFDQLDMRFNRPDKVLSVIGQIFGRQDQLMIEAYQKAYIKRINRAQIDTSLFRADFTMPEADFKNRNQVSYQQNTGKLNLEINAFDPANKLVRFNVWINGIPIYGKGGQDIKSKQSNKLSKSVELNLSKGKNRIEVSVMNINGLESYRSPLFVNYAPIVPLKEITHFVGIGIDRFSDSRYNLQYSTKDIRDMAVKLKNKYGENIIIDTLFNENVSIESVGKLKGKLLQTNVDDKIIIAYSGHGLLTKDFDYYLSTYSVNFDRPEENGLSYNELENLLDGIPARKKLMLIDACHSGEVDKDELIRMNNTADSLKLVKGLKPVSLKKDEKHLGLKNSFELMQSLFVNVGRSTGATIISAAAGTQFALERNDLKNGVFTYCILEAMNKNSSITISGLQKIVSKRVNELTKGLQQPTSRNENVEFDWNVW